MKPFTKKLIRSSVSGIIFFMALVFIPAGTLHYWRGWTYLAVSILASGGYTVYLIMHDQALLRRRAQAGIAYEHEPAQKIIIALLFVAFIALIVVPALDFRFGWSSMPWYISDVGNIMIVGAYYCFYLVSKVNSYAAANIRVEKGQQLVSTGVYALVRHPMYFGALFLILGTPLALGSWWALLLIPLFLPVLYFRILNEEKVLRRDLAGYKEYQQKVRYRLIPYVW